MAFHAKGEAQHGPCKEENIMMTRWNRLEYRLMTCGSLLGITALIFILAVTPAWSAGNREMNKAVITSSSFIDACEAIFEENQTPLSLDFQGAPIQDVIQIISEVSGLNIVLAPEVGGDTTVMLNDVPWGLALDIVLDNASLGRVCDKNIIRVDSKESFRTAKERGELVTEMIRINYANLQEVATRIKALLTPLGSVTFNERTNTLVIMDTSEMVKDLIGVVRNLDIATPQVQIASKIVQIGRTYLQELGIQWGVHGITQRNPAFPNSIQFTGRGGEGSTGAFNTGNIGGGTGGTASVLQGFMVDLAAANPALGLASSLLSRDADLTLDMQLTALERQGKSQILSNPRVSTADNKEAKIRQGQRIPYVTVSQNEGPKVEFVDANLELLVTPHITADQKVYMKITAQQNRPNFIDGIGGVPRIDTNETNTEVLVADGGTAILGGLHQRTQADSRRAIPYLADIPILGLLFKSTVEQDDVSELLIFVTPSIIKAEQPNS